MKHFCKTFLKIGCMLVGLSSTVCAMSIEKMDDISCVSPVTTLIKKDSLGDPRQDLRLSPYPVSNGQLAEIRIGNAPPFYLLRTVHVVPLQFALPPSVLYPLVQRCAFGISEMGDGSDSENSSDSISSKLASMVDELGEEYISDFFVTEKTLLRHQEKINQFLFEDVPAWQEFYKKNPLPRDGRTSEDYDKMIDERCLEMASVDRRSAFPKAIDLLHWDKWANGKVHYYLKGAPIHPIAMQAILEYYNPPELYWHSRGMDSTLTKVFGDFSKRVYSLESQADRILPPALEEIKSKIQNASIREVNKAIQKICEPQQIDAPSTTLPPYVYTACQQYFDKPLQRTTDEGVLHRNSQWIERISDILNETRSSPFLMFVGEDHIVDFLKRLSQRYPMRVRWNPDIE